MGTKRNIVHIDLDTFFVSVERKFDPSLIGKPVLIGGSADRGVVAACSYEARKFGIHSAMPMKTAMRLCPHATVVRGTHGRYGEASREVTQIIHDTVPLYQKTSVDEFYIDLTGMDRFHDCYKFAGELRQKIIRQTGLPISFGMSSGKTVSKIATGLAKPNGQLLVPHGTEKAFLAPLPIKKIPMLGEKTCQKLYSYGIEKIADLQRVDLKFLNAIFGKAGLYIYEKAHGIDHAEIVPHSDRKSISQDHTFESNVTEIRTLETMLTSMTEELAGKLRRENKVAGCLSIKIRFGNFETHTVQEKIALTAAEHILLPGVKNLLKKAWNGHRPIRLIGVKLSNLCTGSYQINLFEDNEEKIKLYQAMDQINFKFGDKTVCRAGGMEIGTRNFNPFMKG
ncbi:DNA polymerase IV [Mucilaginibacter myungsuensis]|uniref:DNA polymerase IV n=1 Tax=Mucilaginibacter myungsuensis TaxID=649104 RepID=A0A929L388_9SPHI|nr:DNA polymerase IV [Mucilaginibacter myungsuensis]MBE9663659.1 DNA polymerase IV [Mucilaginibacter myungsuensis]MDN3599017.1 DNA polymerase IV [Mucilaginibacter myungsuensis]